MKFRACPPTVTIFLKCSLCEETFQKKPYIESIGNIQKIYVICEECAYGIHSAYEANM